MKGKGSNTIFALRVLAERMIEKQKDLYMWVVDYEKVYGKVKHDELKGKIKDE